MSKGKFKKCKFLKALERTLQKFLCCFSGEDDDDDLVISRVYQSASCGHLGEYRRGAEMERCRSARFGCTDIKESGRRRHRRTTKIRDRQEIPLFTLPGAMHMEIGIHNNPAEYSRQAHEAGPQESLEY